ncbi:MAG: divergent polysaccharide deacetylase family protein, partial [Alphaproteobacteria bacterium]|nr:divergent polysaccharide deacetylase family protein [Alphaproteobacteria bacterium]
LSGTGYFFFDSRTTASTKVVPLARDFGILSAGRDVFLDDKQDPDYVLGQLRALQRVANATGVAIAIGHPHPVTLQVLRDWLSRHRSVRLVNLRTALRLKTQNALLRTVTAKASPRLIGPVR